MTGNIRINPALLETVRPVLDRRLRPIDFEVIHPAWRFFRPCRVKVLLLADGGLHFGDGDAGMSAFVEALRTIPGNHVRFDITLAHIRNVNGALLQQGAPGIIRSIPGFKFDNPDHFTPNLYDQVWMFGIDSTWQTANRGQGYPTDRLSNAELVALSQFMNQGGGLFCTGDHGALGKALSHAVPRARNMRRWDSAFVGGFDEVSMRESRRKDTNRIGTVPGSHSNDQADDVPQDIQPKLYTRRTGLWRYSFPHPIFCGPEGMIRVMPDHPHEGECIEPTNPNLTVNLTGAAAFAEYPPATDGGARPLPEIIARSTVLSGTTSSGKDPAHPQSFGAMSAYDGHRAGVGRVVTEATWHHYTNMNLIGLTNTNNAVWAAGFLYSQSGQDHLQQIFTYMRNIAVWMSRPSQLTCMRQRLSIWTVLHERVVEAVIDRSRLELRQANLSVFIGIGKHARDVLGNFVGACQASQIIIDYLWPVIPERLRPQFDIWNRPPELEEREEFIPFLDLQPMMDAALGGALLSLHGELDKAAGDEKFSFTEKHLEHALQTGAKAAVETSLKQLDASLKGFAELTGSGSKPPEPTKPVKPTRPTGGGRIKR
jgi:hypothetical protein